MKVLGEEVSAIDRAMFDPCDRRTETRRPVDDRADEAAGGNPGSDSTKRKPGGWTPATELEQENVNA